MFVLQLGLIGLCVAMLPLSYVWVSADTSKFRKLLWVTTFLTLDLVMFGSFTRLTDSGLGCPDWPGCYGTSSPFIAHAAISAAQQALPTGPVTITKAWIEMIHRYLAMALGALIVVQMVIGWIRRRSLPLSPWWPTLLFALVCLQGAFGAWTVTLKLQPVIVTTHLLLALVLLGTLGWIASSLTPVPPGQAVPGGWQWAAIAGLLLLVVQIALGGWVSTNYAVLACLDFPTCQGRWVPSMDFAQGFHLWRALGRTANGDYISQQALIAIHWTHRVFAFVVFAYLLWLSLKLKRFTRLAGPAKVLLVLLFVQMGTGMSNILLRWPLANAVAHNGGAAILMLTLVMLNYRLASSRFGPAVASTGAAIQT
ncbi:MAG: COX15/CtaA family protein [Janthinobacterium lividum]